MNAFLFVKIFFYAIMECIFLWNVKLLLEKGYRMPADVWLPHINVNEYDQILLVYYVAYIYTALGKQC